MSYKKKSNNIIISRSNQFSILDEDYSEPIKQNKKSKPKKLGKTNKKQIIEESFKQVQSLPRVHTKNIKRVLCENVIKNGKCKYEKTCSYAHRLSEQKIDDDRKLILEILEKNKSLKALDLINNAHIFRTLASFTQMCSKCETNECIGGYNCKLGAPLKYLIICKTDFISGNCNNEECEKIHLTDKGLVPYSEQKMKSISDNCTYDHETANVLFNDPDTNSLIEEPVRTKTSLVEEHLVRAKTSDNKESEVIEQLKLEPETKFIKSESTVSTRTNSSTNESVIHGSRSYNKGEVLTISSVTSLMTQHRKYVSITEKIKEIKEYYGIKYNNWITI
jgi:hypothetical protein